MATLKVSDFVPIHSRLIRDIKFNSAADDGILLSCGDDKTLKLTSMYTNNSVHWQVFTSCSFSFSSLLCAYFCFSIRILIDVF